MNLAWTWVLVLYLALVLRAHSFHVMRTPTGACRHRGRVRVLRCNRNDRNHWEVHNDFRELNHGLGAGDFSAGAGMISIPGKYKKRRKQEQRRRSEHMRERGGPFSPDIPVEGRKVDQKPNYFKWLPRPLKTILVRGNEDIMVFWAKHMDRDALSSMITIMTREMSLRKASDGISWLPEKLRGPATNLVDATVDAIEDTTHNFFEWKDDRAEEEKRKEQRERQKERRRHA